MCIFISGYFFYVLPIEKEGKKVVKHVRLDYRKIYKREGTFFSFWSNIYREVIKGIENFKSLTKETKTNKEIDYYFQTEPS